MFLHGCGSEFTRRVAILTVATAAILGLAGVSAAAPGDRTVHLTSAVGANGAFDVEFQGAMEDGSRVWFRTAAPHPALGDTDTSNDVYERALDGTLRLITPAGAAPFGANFHGASQDGSRVWFTTAEPNPALSDTAMMHWQIHKDGAAHLRDRDGRVPVAVAIGSDPVVTYAASAPLRQGSTR